MGGKLSPPAVFFTIFLMLNYSLRCRSQEVSDSDQNAINPNNADTNILVPRLITRPLQITSYEDKTVLLPCQVLNLPTNMHLIWQFSRSPPSDPQALQTVLTIGQTQIENYNYRVRLINNMTNSNTRRRLNLEKYLRVATNDLEIRKLRVQDSGWYECQLPTRPTQKNYVYLLVHGVPKISVKRQHSKFHNGQHLVELTCHVNNKPLNSTALFWTLDENPINATTIIDNFSFHSLNRNSSHARRIRRLDGLDGEKKGNGYTVLNNVKMNVTRLRISSGNGGENGHKGGVYRCHYDSIETEFRLDYLNGEPSKKGHLKYEYTESKSASPPSAYAYYILQPTALICHLSILFRLWLL